MKIIRSRFLSNALNTFLKIRYKSDYSNLLSKKDLDIFDYKNLAVPLPKCFTDPIPDNNYWGISKSIQEYCGLKKIDAWIEHGYFWGSYVQQAEIESYTKRIITFSNKKKEDILRKCNKEVIPIGPYIHYVEPILNKESFETLKSELGKVLTLIPSHAGSGSQLDYNVNEIINDIEGIQSKYDTKIVCLFWTDAIKPDLVNKYVQAGFKVFCAGHRYDPYFLSRQRTLLELSDIVISNGVGTHIGYAAYLRKPVWIINQEVKAIAINKKGTENKNIRNEEEHQTGRKEIDFIKSIFSTYSENLTEEQYNKCGSIFGFDCIKTKEELRTLLK